MTSLNRFQQGSTHRTLRTILRIGVRTTIQAQLQATLRAILRAIGWLLMHQPRRQNQDTASAGFTLLELLVVLLMVTVLMAIGAPVWLSMADGQRLGAVQDDAFRSLRLGQSKARQQKRIWEVCFRNDLNNTRTVQYSVHPAKGDKCGNANWQPLGAEAATFTAIDAAKSSLVKGGGAYVVQFNANGWLASAQDGAQSSGNDDNAEKRITFQLAGRPDLTVRTCVYMETLLGSLRAARDANCD